MLETLRRDLRTVAGGFFGRRPPPFVVRAPLARHLLAQAPLTAARGGGALEPRGSAAGLGARDLRVARVVRETRDAVTLHFEERFPFIPGQFLTLLVDLDGETLRRAYSICTAPSEGVAITVKRNGRVSQHLNERVRAGDTLRVLGPSGSFGFAPDSSVRRRILLIGGGSGITPLFSVAKSVLEVERESEVALVYANRTPDDVIFRDAIDELARNERFTVKHTFGLFDARAIPSTPDDTEIFLCGPAPMMDLARAALAGKKLREERFTSPSQARALPTAPQEITVRARSSARRFVVLPEQTILESALANGVALPFSCTMGGCGACKLTLVEGEVAMDEPHCLTAAEVARGEVLTCVSRARSKITLQLPPSSVGDS